MNALSVALLNETWFFKSDPQTRKLLIEIGQENRIEFIRKDRDSRGGGVAIAFDTNKIKLKKLNLNCLKDKKTFGNSGG